MTETELTAEIMKLAAREGVLAHHCRDSRRCEGPRGFPDLVFVGPHGMILAELKSQDGETDASQDRWGWTINTIARTLEEEYCGGALSYELWRPADYESGKIERRLKELV